MRRLAGLVAALLLVLTPLPVRAQPGEVPSVRLVIQSVLEMETWRRAERLPRVTLDATHGDLTVVFAMRRPLSDDPHQIVASAVDDVFTILWAAYASPVANQIHTTTVLGTYAVVGRYSRPKEIPLMRAVLSADRAANFDWANAGRLDPRQVLDEWWVEGELLD